MESISKLNGARKWKVMALRYSPQNYFKNTICILKDCMGLFCVCVSKVIAACVVVWKELGMVELLFSDLESI